MNWVYKESNGVEWPVTDEFIPEHAVGFVYIMTAFIDGEEKKYIGKKNFYSIRKKKFGKKALANMTDKRAKKYSTIKKLDYENYFSSNKELKEAHKKGIPIQRKIIKICYSKIELTYQETKYLFKYNVLEDDTYLNGNILGRFYKGKLKTDE
jgi:hypothetical protein